MAFFMFSNCAGNSETLVGVIMIEFCNIGKLFSATAVTDRRTWAKKNER